MNAAILGSGGVGSSGGGGGSNASVGPTGATAPTSATEIGIIVAGNLVGVSSANPIPVSGAGGTQYTDETIETAGAFQITVAGLYNGTDVVGLRGDASNNLLIKVNTALPAGTNLIGQVEITDGTNILGTSTHPVRIDPTGTTVQPISAISLPLPTNAAEETGGNLATIAGAVSSSVLQDNIKNWGGTGVTAATSSNPAGTEVAPVTRPILRKQSSILSTTPLAANGVFTSAWVDTTVTGDVYVFVAFFSNVVSSGSLGCQIQQTDDTTNTNTQQTTIFGAGGSQVGQGQQINQRYWRVVYTNGATLQTSFELTATASSIVPQIGLTANNFVGSNGSVLAALKTAGISNSGVSEGNPTYQTVGHAASTGVVGVGMMAYTGASNGSTVFFKIPNIFKTAQATASGNTALWTPTSGKKFRLLKLYVQVTAAAALASAGVLTITFQDSSTGIPIAFDVYLPASSISAPLGDAFSSGWIDLGNGVLSATANNVLNINLSGTVSTGNVRVTCCGTEE